MSKGSFPCDLAIQAAEKATEILAPGCVEIAYAGSLRRGKEWVGDIELVALPIWNTDPLQFPEAIHHKIDGCIIRAIQAGVLKFDPVTKRNGARYKRLLLPPPSQDHFSEIPVDLFLTDDWNFGSIFLMRTGCAAYSAAIMRLCNQSGLKHHEGHLYQTSPEGYKRLPVRTEQGFYRLLNLPYLSPLYRNEEAADEVNLLAERRKDCARWANGGSSS